MGFIANHLKIHLTARGERWWAQDIDLSQAGPIPRAPHDNLHRNERTHPPCTIIHQGAISRIGLCETDPQHCFDVNVGGTVRVLEYARQYGHRVLFVSSSAAANPELTNYGMSKSMGETLCWAYWYRYLVPVLIVRPFNVYGPGEPSEPPRGTLLGTWLNRERQGLPLQITSDGWQSRDFIHVEDVCHWLHLLACLPNRMWESFSAPIDLGSGDSYSLNTLAALFTSPKEYLPARPGDLIAGKPTCTKADTTTLAQLDPNWKPHNVLDYIQEQLAIGQ